MVHATSCYDFIFHPFSDDLPKETGRWAQITFGVLSVCTAGAYALIVLVVRVGEAVINCFSSSPSSGKAVVAKPLPRRRVKPQRSGVRGVSPEFRDRYRMPRGRFVGCRALNAILSDQVRILQHYARQGKWRDIATHTSDPYSGFDWWLFPLNRSSRGQGRAYTVNSEHIRQLISDPEFMLNYREGVRVVALSWGWDIRTERDVTNREQKWRCWDFRLRKMTESLLLFGERNLLKKLYPFIRKYRLQSKLSREVQADYVAWQSR